MDRKNPANRYGIDMSGSPTQIELAGIWGSDILTAPQLKGHSSGMEILSAGQFKSETGLDIIPAGTTFMHHIFGACEVLGARNKTLYKNSNSNELEMIFYVARSMDGALHDFMISDVANAVKSQSESDSGSCHIKLLYNFVFLFSCLLSFPWSIHAYFRIFHVWVWHGKNPMRNNGFVGFYGSLALTILGIIANSVIVYIGSVYYLGIHSEIQSWMIAWFTYGCGLILCIACNLAYGSTEYIGMFHGYIGDSKMINAFFGIKLDAKRYTILEETPFLICAYIFIALELASATGIVANFILTAKQNYNMSCSAESDYVDTGNLLCNDGVCCHPNIVPLDPAIIVATLAGNIVAIYGIGKNVLLHCMYDVKRLDLSAK